MINPRAAVQPTNNSHAEHLPSPLPPKLSLDAFCLKYDLSFAIQTKLVTADITGPHGLRFLQPTEMSSDLKLTVGERCDVQDALEQWTKDLN